MSEQVSTRKATVVETDLCVQGRDCNRWAVIVGISKYKHAALNLQYADRDAEKLYQLLLTPQGGHFQFEGAGNRAITKNTNHRNSDL